MKLVKIALTPPIIAISVAISAALGAQAEKTINVPGDYADVAAAVAAAEDGDTVQIGVGTFSVNAALTLGNVKVVGAGPGQTIITRDGKNYNKAKLFILTNEGALVDNLTIKDVYAQDVGGTSGSIIEFPNTTGKGKVSRLVVEGCTAGSSGAGYVCYIGQNASAEVEDVIFRNNTMRDSGGSGVLYANGATSAKVKNCAFIRNADHTTGAIRIRNNCEVVNCTFADNRTNYTQPGNARGGAVYLENIASKKTILSNCVFFADHAWYDTTPMSPEVYYSSINATLTNCFFDCAWDAKVPAIGKGAISIAESEFTDIYSDDFRPHANSALIREDGTVCGGLAASDATGPAFTPEGPAEITLTLDDSINDAIHAAPEGQVINLAEGIYSVTDTLWIAKGITLKGAGRDKTFLMREGTAYNSLPYLRLEHPDAVVCGVTISNVTATANNQAGVLLVAAQGGEFRDARITKSKGAGSGTGSLLGIAGGRLHHTFINDNTVFGASRESIIYMWGGQLDNCLVRGNSYFTQGCISLRGNAKVVNCTFADNTARTGNTSYQCAGVCWYSESNYNPTGARVYNCIFTRGSAENDSSEGRPEWLRVGGTAANMAASFSHCGWGSNVPLIGEGSVAVTDDGFVDPANGDYHLKTTSGAYENGFACDELAAKDLDGNDRQQGDNPDIGCFEAEAGKLTLGIKIEPTVGFVGGKFHCMPVITGLPDGVAYTCRWTFKNETMAEDDVVSTDAEHDQVFGTAGFRSVSLALYDDKGELLIEAEPELNYLNVGVSTCYIAAPDDPTAEPAYPYATPETAAKTNLATLVATAVPGQTIRLRKGTIDAGGVVNLSGLRVIGEGWNETFITNAPLYERTDYPQNGFLVLNQAGSLLDNLCISNVETHFNGASVINVGANGGTVSRVKVIGCRGGAASTGYIAGVYGTNSLITGCAIVNCTVQENGGCGGIYAENGGRVDNTLVDGMMGLEVGGGIVAVDEKTTIRNCTVVRNHIGTTPAFRKMATATGFVFWRHHDYDVGSKFINCLAACNEMPTVVGAGGSAWQGGGNEVTRALCVSNCAFSADAALTGTDCILIEDVNVAFRNPARGDFRLRRNSPCVDAGLDDGWTEGDTDLLGDRRKVGEHVDIGCYENQQRGMMLLVR